MELHTNLMIFFLLYLLLYHISLFVCCFYVSFVILFSSLWWELCGLPSKLLTMGPACHWNPAYMLELDCKTRSLSFLDNLPKKTLNMLKPHQDCTHNHFTWEWRFPHGAYFFHFDKDILLFWLMLWSEFFHMVTLPETGYSTCVSFTVGTLCFILLTRRYFV